MTLQKDRSLTLLEDRLVDTKRAASVLGLKPFTLRRWRIDGEGPRFCKLGGAVRYRLSDLEKFVEAGSSTAAAE